MRETSSPALTGYDINLWRSRIRQDVFANYHHKMGVALIRVGQAAAAREAFQRALNIDPTHFAAALRLMKLHEGAQEMEAMKAVATTAQTQDPDALILGLAQGAEDELDAEDPAAAAQSFVKALAAGPRVLDRYAHILLRILQRSPPGDVVEALIDPALARSDREHELLFSMGRHLLAKGRAAEAANLFILAGGNTEAPVMTWHFAGLSLFAAGDHGRAADWFAKVLATPDRFRGDALAFGALALLALDDVDAALALFAGNQSDVSLSPRARAIQIFAEWRRDGQGGARMEHLLRTNGERGVLPQAHFLYGLICLEGSPSQAIMEFDAAALKAGQFLHVGQGMREAGLALLALREGNMEAVRTHLAAISKADLGMTRSLLRACGGLTAPLLALWPESSGQAGVGQIC